tara:strand:- start:851 stop:1117 length:267 start_codon:yes stop_codon:yes gene_type:complete
MLTKRDYKLTPESRDWGVTWKVEVWNDFGMKRTVYENNVMDASKVVYDWWERSEEEFDTMNKLNRAIHSAHQIDRKSGILKGNRDGLD